MHLCWEKFYWGILLALSMCKLILRKLVCKKGIKWSFVLTLFSTWDIMSINIFLGSGFLIKDCFLLQCFCLQSVSVFFKVNFWDYKAKIVIKTKVYDQSPSLILNHCGSFSFIFKFGAIFFLSFSPLGFFWLEMYIISFLPTSPSKRNCPHPQTLLNRWA